MPEFGSVGLQDKTLGQNPYPYPSVTQVLEPYSGYENIPGAVLTKAQIRGTTVHSCCFTICRGLPMIPNPLPEYLPRINSFRKWFDLNVDEVLEIEPTLVDMKLRYLGHPDLILISRNFGLCLPDIKTAESYQPIWIAQLSAYHHLALQAGYAIESTFSLMLDSGGGMPRIVPLPNPEKHFFGFYSLLSWHHYFHKLGGI